MFNYGTLELGEIHPCSKIALQFVREYLLEHDANLLLESLASTALSGSRAAEICLETLDRLLAKERVSDRYLMGLAWFLWQMDQDENE